MKRAGLPLPEIGLISGTRAMGGAGIGLLLADRLSEKQRKAVGWTLFLIGASSTVPLGNSRALGHKKRGGTTTTRPSHTFLKALYYLSRSLALPNLSLAVPLVWSARPSAFFSLSPVTAPAASLALPFALSSAPSPLSWLLLFLPTCSFSFLRLGHVQCTVYLYALRLKRLRLERGGETSLFTSFCRAERSGGESIKTHRIGEVLIL